jgi:hypothetical protein
MLRHKAHNIVLLFIESLFSFAKIRQKIGKAKEIISQIKHDGLFKRPYLLVDIKFLCIFAITIKFWGISSSG